jgi:DNA polymerase III subunit epsilon
MPVDIKILEYYFWKQYTLKHKIKKAKKQLSVEPIITEIEEYNKFATNRCTDLSELTFTVFDLETTGFFPELGDEIISIGAIRVRNKKVIYDDTFYKIIKPLNNISKLTKELTGLTKTELDRSDYFPSILKEFLEFSKGSILVAHPASFDIPFLKYYIKSWGLPQFSPEYIDSHALANWLHPTKTNYLDRLVEDFQITKRNRHHALNDSIMTAEIFEKLLEECKQLSKLEELLSVTGT